MTDNIESLIYPVSDEEADRRIKEANREAHAKGEAYGNDNERTLTLIKGVKDD